MPPNPTTAHYCDALYRAETAEARVARLEAERAWRPIETAPRDGTRILLYQAEGDGTDPTRTIAEGRWEMWAFGQYEWCMAQCDAWGAPTHWMPLPEPPDA